MNRFKFESLIYLSTALPFFLLIVMVSNATGGTGTGQLGDACAVNNDCGEVLYCHGAPRVCRPSSVLPARDGPPGPTGKKYRRGKATQIVLMGSDAATPGVARRVVVGPVIFPANPAMITRLATIVPNATRNRSVTRIFRDETRSERWTGFPEIVLLGEPAFEQRVGDSLLVYLPMLRPADGQIGILRWPRPYEDCARRAAGLKVSDDRGTP